MNRIAVAQELVKLAKNLSSGFQDEMDKQYQSGMEELLSRAVEKNTGGKVQGIRSVLNSVKIGEKKYSVTVTVLLGKVKIDWEGTVGYFVYRDKGFLADFDLEVVDGSNIKG
jgi:hypothetical protein